MRDELYRMFPVLVIEHGLSVNEAMACGLSQVIGLSRTQTAEMMSRLIQREVTPGAVSKYVSCARIKVGPFDYRLDGPVDQFRSNLPDFP